LGCPRERSRKMISYTVRKRSIWHRLSVSLIIPISLSLFLLLSCHREQKYTHIRLGITPYQDTALPVVAEKMGWYKEKGIQIDFVPLDWGDVMLGLSSGSIDAAIYTINAFEAPYESAASGSRQPVFYSPIYIFKGTAIMVHQNSGITPFQESPNEPPDERKRKVAQIAKQLKGKRIAVTQGTEYEQLVLAALNAAGLNPKKDVTLIHASPSDALAAFLSGNIDAFGAGLTERVEARRHGGIEFLVAADLGQVSIDGIVTTAEFAKHNQDALDSLTSIWFKTIQFVGADPKNNSAAVRDYLAQRASTKYSPDEYAIAWTFNIFPDSPTAAANLFNRDSSRYYWKTAWKEVGEFLIQQKKITSPIPESAYWGEPVLSRLQQQPAK
jgi:ABC-type nitrate/sulfonate/bicarbonate transport system substrate-binding protein